MKRRNLIEAIRRRLDSLPDNVLEFIYYLIIKY